MLINCPNCGKSVSDKAKECLHCGFCLNEQSELKGKEENNVSVKKKNYFELDYNEQQELLLQFSSEEPVHHKVISSDTKRAKMQLILGGVAILLTIIGIIVLLTVGKNRLDVVDPQVGDFIVAFGVLAIAFIMWAVFAVLIIIEKMGRQKSIIAYKHYELWLNKRNIEGFADELMDSSIERERLEDLDL